MSLEKKSDEKRREGGGGGRSVWLVWWGWRGERRRHGAPVRAEGKWMRPFYHVWLWNARALANRGVLCFKKNVLYNGLLW